APSTITYSESVKFETVINLKIARTLGLEIHPGCAVAGTPCPLLLQKRTCAAHWFMSALC
ncbi:MAG: hypothetical protein WA764_08000, partial [Pseudolabrys sp.]